MKWLYKLEWKYGRFAIPNLMLAIVLGMLTVFLGDLFFPQLGLSSYLYFDRELLLTGQVWRLLSFIVLPPPSTPLFILLALYFYYTIGQTLEHAWGSFKFNVYYLCGILGAILAGMVTGFAENAYLNLSLFLAFAALYPENQIRLFFILPIKIKYLAYLNGAFLLIAFIFGGWSTRAAIIMSLVNFFLFFGGDFISFVKMKTSTMRTRWNFKRSMKK